jgi:hypothetical protein
MDIIEISKLLFQYGGTIIMAVLFVWVFITDKTKNNQLQQDNNTMLKILVDNQKNATESNNNIAKSLEIISNNLVTIDKKIDRNYEVEVKNNI